MTLIVQMMHYVMFPMTSKLSIFVYIHRFTPTYILLHGNSRNVPMIHGEVGSCGRSGRPNMSRLTQKLTGEEAEDIDVPKATETIQGDQDDGKGKRNSTYNLS